MLEAENTKNSALNEMETLQDEAKDEINDYKQESYYKEDDAYNAYASYQEALKIFEVAQKAYDEAVLAYSAAQ